VKIGSEWGSPIYLDSSALVKIYVAEAETDALEKALEGRRDLVISDLVITELVSALARRKREGVLDTRAVNGLHRTLLADIQAGDYRTLDLVPAVHREAERLVILLDQVALRAADALHLALAVSAGCATVVTFDRRMIEAAPYLGVTPVPIT